MNRPPRARLSVWPGVACLGILALSWNALASSGVIPEGQLPSLGEVLQALVREGPELFSQVLATLRLSLGAFVLGGLAGISLGLCHGLCSGFRRTTHLVIEGLRPLPSVSLIPLSVIFLGMQGGLNVCVAAFACMWPGFISSRDGVLGVSPVHVDTARTLGLGRADLVRRVILPAAFPSIANGLRISLAVAFAVEVSVEMVLPKQGLGALATNAALAGETGLLFGVLLVAGATGLALNHLLHKAVLRLLRPYGPEWGGQA